MIKKGYISEKGAGQAKLNEAIKNDSNDEAARYAIITLKNYQSSENEIARNLTVIYLFL